MKKATKWISRIVIALLAVLAIGVATCVALVYLKPKISEEKKPEPEPEAVVEPKPISATANYLFAGTTFWGRRTNTMARASDLGVKYPFSQLDTLDRKNYDAWIGGLECPVTDNGHNKAEEENIFKFNCDPDYLPEAAKYFDAFLLGNNHAGNQGKAGLETTRAYLKKNNIQYFGTPKRTANNKRDPEYPNDDVNVNNCGIVVLPVRIALDDGTEDKYKIPFGFCSAHGVYGVPGEDYLQNMKDFAQYVPTIAMPHMGAEYKTSHDTMRQNLYRKMIDYGDVKYEKKSYLKNYMFDGIILAALGLIMLVWPNEALKVLCCVSGGLLAVMGFIRLALFLMSSKEDRTVSALIIAILQLAVGIVLIIASDFFVKLFFIVTGLLLAYGAILMFVRMIQLRRVKGPMFYFSMFFGIAYLIFAVIILINPVQFANFTTHIQGAALVIEGIGMIIVLRNLKLTLTASENVI